MISLWICVSCPASRATGWFLEEITTSVLITQQRCSLGRERHAGQAKATVIKISNLLKTSSLQLKERCEWRENRPDWGFSVKCYSILTKSEFPFLCFSGLRQKLKKPILKQSRRWCKESRWQKKWLRKSFLTRRCSMKKRSEPWRESWYTRLSLLLFFFF